MGHRHASTAARLGGPLFLLLALAGLPSCLGFGHHPNPSPLPGWAADLGLRRIEVRAGHFIGLSDLSAERRTDGSTQLWLVPERQRALLTLALPRGRAADTNGQTIEAVPTGVVSHAIEGVPPYLDTESLAALGDGHFALGTEAPWPQRTHDDVLFATLGPKGAHVASTLPFPYAPFGLLGESNAGLEGLCSTGGRLLAASETSGVLEDGGRFAPLGLLTLGERAFWPLRLRLSSETGRISALACRPAADASLEVMAIERNYGVARLLRFVLPLAAPALAVLTPEVVLDLAEVMRPLRNYEGIAWLPSGELLLVTDNSIGFATGPTEGLVVPAAVLGAKGN